MVKVSFADNNSIIRSGIRRILADDPRVEVVGETSDFTEAIAQAHEVKPDVMVLDLHMPFEPGLFLRELAAQLENCGTGIVGITAANDDVARSLAIHMGAAELVDKMRLVTELLPAIIRVASADKCFRPVAPTRLNSGSQLR